MSGIWTSAVISCRIGNPPRVSPLQMRPILPAFLLAVTTSSLGAQQATLTYMLGKDTSAVEQYTHQGNRISGMMVQRAGAAVSVVRYEMTYGADGRVTTARIARSQPDGSAIAGQPTETAFVGGLNLTSVAMVRHDVYVEMTGPSATDLRHNFVERWKEIAHKIAITSIGHTDAPDAEQYRQDLVMQ